MTPAAALHTAGANDASAWADLGIVPARAIRVVGMRRSGNHAICNWLQRNAPGGRSLFLNNCRPGTDPLRSHRGLEAAGKRVAGDLPAAAATAGDGALLLVSYEETAHARFDPERPMSGPRGDAAFDGEVLIYRSFLNWSTSLLKKMQGNATLRAGERMATAVRALATYTDLLAEVDAAAETGRVPVCYDRWVADEAYRASCLGALGLPLQDNGLGAVQTYGGGPTFQKEAAAAGDLRPDGRWRAMLGDPEYQALLRVAALDRTLVDRVRGHFAEDAVLLERIADLPLFDAEALA